MASPFPLQSRADCEDNFALIRAWISQCERHPTCKRTPLFAPELQLPTRLIDIGTGSEDSTPRLVISADLGETADCRYVALSHCWGDPRKVEVPKTLRKTLGEHRKSITGLNKTFQDAFEVTRQIGVRYLWIDSLCIIQDEEEDFKAECSRMSLVYAQAYCVLSALDAEDGNVGLFIPRSPLAQPSQISLTEKRWKSMLNGPLSSRGWAFQEHQLARRIVHFTNVRILWECRVCIACEDSPSQLYRSFVSAMTGEHISESCSKFTTWRLFDGKHESHDNITEGDRRNWQLPDVRFLNDVHTRWLRAVELYSSRKLTYETDKLPAISGLAAAVAAVRASDVYLAGLWKDDLIRGLLWTAVPSGPDAIHERISSIPTWSWASYRDGVSFLALKDIIEGPRWIGTVDFLVSRTEGEYPANLTARTNTSNQFPFGEVKGGTMQVTTLMNTYDIGVHPGSSVYHILHNTLRVKIFLDYPSATMHSGVVFATLLCGRGIYGLLLKRSDSKVFRRLGVFHTPSNLESDFWRASKQDTVTVE